MLCLKSKIAFFTLLLSLLLVSCNNNETNIEKKEVTKTDSIALTPTETFTLLLSGPPPPPMYSNALDIMEKVYNIDFIYAAGCIVDEGIGDSISAYNDRTFYNLNKYYHRDISTGLFAQLDQETAFLNRVDSSIRNKESIKNTYNVVNKSIYYTKKDKNYLAHFISAIPDGKVLNFKLNLIMTIDSASKNITGTVLKDSLIDSNFRNLSHD